MSSFQTSLASLGASGVAQPPGPPTAITRLPSVFFSPPSERNRQSSSSWLSMTTSWSSWPCDLERVGVLAEVAGADDLVPEVHRARLVAAEEDHVLGGLGDKVERPSRRPRSRRRRRPRPSPSLAAASSSAFRPMAKGRIFMGKSAAAWSLSSSPRMRAASASASCWVWIPPSSANSSGSGGWACRSSARA